MSLGILCPGPAAVQSVLGDHIAFRVHQVTWNKSLLSPPASSLPVVSATGSVKCLRDSDGRGERCLQRPRLNATKLSVPRG